MTSYRLTPLQQQLRSHASLDMRTRSIALGAVDEMMDSANRASDLLAQAQFMASRSSNPTVGPAAALAREAYALRTKAEVLKYKAAYAMMAEEEGAKATDFKSQAVRAPSKKLHAPLVERVKYHEARRDLMLQAARATDKALNQIPPLPDAVTKNANTLPSTHELLASPTLGYRPKSFSKLTGNFFPEAVQSAAGALHGGFGEAADGAPSAPAWMDSLRNALGYGVRAAGQAAASEGEKTATSNPSGGAALNLGSNILSTLSNMIGGSNGVAQSAAPIQSTGPDVGTIVLVGGVLTVGGLILWKLTKGKS